MENNNLHNILVFDTDGKKFVGVGINPNKQEKIKSIIPIDEETFKKYHFHLLMKYANELALQVFEEKPYNSGSIIVNLHFNASKMNEENFNPELKKQIIIALAGLCNIMSGYHAQNVLFGKK